MFIQNTSFFLAVHKWYEQRTQKKTFSLIFFISTFVDWGYKTATALKAFPSLSLMPRFRIHLRKKRNINKFHSCHTLCDNKTLHISFIHWVMGVMVAYMHKNFPFNLFFSSSSISVLFVFHGCNLFSNFSSSLLPHSILQWNFKDVATRNLLRNERLMKFQ